MSEGRRRHDPPDDELPPWPPAGVENQDFGIATRRGEEEGLDKGEENSVVLDGAHSSSSFGRFQAQAEPPASAASGRLRLVMSQSVFLLTEVALAEPSFRRASMSDAFLVCITAVCGESIRRS